MPSSRVHGKFSIHEAWEAMGSICCTLASVLGAFHQLCSFTPRLGMAGHPFACEIQCGLIAAMTVDEDEAAEALAMQARQHVLQHREIGRYPEADRAGIGKEIGRDPIGEHREDRQRQRLRRRQRDALRQDRIDRKREMGMLLGRAERDDRAIVGLQIGLDLAPSSYRRFSSQPFPRARYRGALNHAARCGAKGERA